MDGWSDGGWLAGWLPGWLDGFMYVGMESPVLADRTLRDLGKPTTLGAQPLQAEVEGLGLRVLGLRVLGFRAWEFRV